MSIYEDIISRRRAFGRTLLSVVGVLMLFFFRCKKPMYYAIVLAAAVAIWAAFRFGLGVLF